MPETDLTVHHIKWQKSEMRKMVIGDIHGQFNALKEVLTKSKFDYEKDKLIILGDIVDGGFNTYKVIEELLKIKNIVYIIGNHDEWFMNYIKSGWAEEIWLQQGGADTLRSYGAEVKEASNITGNTQLNTTNLKIPVTHQDFFNRGVYWHEEDNMMFVHGGFKVGIHPNQETKFNLLWDRNIVNAACLYEKTGQKIGKWDKIFIGHTTTQMFGNNPTVKDCLQPLKFSNLIMMDTGAGCNGRLSLMDIHSEEFWVSEIQKSII